jgi:hypothetical protein
VSTCLHMLRCSRPALLMMCSSLTASGAIAPHVSRLKGSICACCCAAVSLYFLCLATCLARHRLPVQRRWPSARGCDTTTSVSTCWPGKIYLQIGTSPVGKVEADRLACSLAAYGEHGVIQRVDHSVVPQSERACCTQLLGAAQEVPAIVCEDALPLARRTAGR